MFRKRAERVGQKWGKKLKTKQNKVIKIKVCTEFWYDSKKPTNVSKHHTHLVEMSFDEVTIW